MSEQWYEHLPMHSLQHSSECSNTQPDPVIFSETHVLVFLEKISSVKFQQALFQWVEEIREWAKRSYLFGWAHKTIC